MEFFGITHYGPQNFFNDILIEEYKEPLSKEDVKLLMEKVLKYSTCPNNVGRNEVLTCLNIYFYRYIINRILQFQRPDADVARTIDCYMGKVNGFAYGSSQRFIKMKRKGVMKPVGPADMYRFPPVTSVDVSTSIMFAKGLKKFTSSFKSL